MSADSDNDSDVSKVMMITDLVTILPGLDDHVLTRVCPAQRGRGRSIRGRDKLSLLTEM